MAAWKGSNPWKVLAQLDEVIARAYLRVSEDHSGWSRSTVEQDDDLSQSCEENGWRMGESYEDSSIGASRLSHKERPKFDRLISDLEADRFGARVLLMWAVTRGSRRVTEWVNLIELCEQRSVYIWVHVLRRLFDPANPHDRLDLIKLAADGEAQASLSSEAIRRANRANVKAGRPHGRIQYGYSRLYDPKTKQFVAQVEELDEGAVMREFFQRLVAGHSFRGIEKDWKARGIRNRSGKFFTAKGMRSMALSPTYAGMRAHIPGRTGGRPKMIELKDLHRGDWPALVSLPDWLAVQRMLHDPNRVSKTRPGRGKYLATRIGKCGICGAVLSSGYPDGVAEYLCGEKKCVRIRMSVLDDYLNQKVKAYIDLPEVLNAIRAQENADNTELTEVVTELAEKRTLRSELARQIAGLGETKFSREFAEETEPLLATRIKQLEARYEELSTPSILRGLVGPDGAARWDDAPISARRRLLALILTPEWLGELRVLHSPNKGGRNGCPAQDRVTWRRNDQAGDAPAAVA